MLAFVALENIVGELDDVDEGLGAPVTDRFGCGADWDITTVAKVDGAVSAMTMKNMPIIAKTDVNKYFILFTTYVKKEKKV
jgi:hypothetical protein